MPDPFHIMQKLPFGPVAQCDVGNKSENMKKNRLLNLRACKLFFLSSKQNLCEQIQKGINLFLGTFGRSKMLLYYKTICKGTKQGNSTTFLYFKIAGTEYHLVLLG